MEHMCCVTELSSSQCSGSNMEWISCAFTLLSTHTSLCVTFCNHCPSCPWGWHSLNTSISNFISCLKIVQEQLWRTSPPYHPRWSVLFLLKELHFHSLCWAAEGLLSYPKHAWLFLNHTLPQSWKIVVPPFLLSLGQEACTSCVILTLSNCSHKNICWAYGAYRHSK